jgi:hypothetical protein
MTRTAALSRALLVIACSLAGSGWLTQPSAAQTSQFKGWSAVWMDLSVRIAPRDRPIDANQFLPSEEMDDLLGTWSTFGSEHTFRNGVPNSLNMLIWQVALSAFADAVAQSCTVPRLAFHESFTSTLRQLCVWPEAPASSDGVLEAFWLAIMGYSATPQDFAAWRDFFRASYAGRSAADTIKAMTLAITLHPSFLLHR